MKSIVSNQPPVTFQADREHDNSQVGWILPRMYQTARCTRFPRQTSCEATRLQEAARAAAGRRHQHFWRHGHHRLDLHRVLHARPERGELGLESTGVETLWSKSRSGKIPPVEASSCSSLCVCMNTLCMGTVSMCSRLPSSC